MQLSTTSKYAIQILGFMARNKSVKYSSKELSDQLNIPYKYLTKVMTKLTKSEIISSTKGKYGGFNIIQNIKKIRMIDIVSVFDDIYTQDCVISEVQCDENNSCIMHDTWQKPKCAIDDFFTQTTLYNLVENSIIVDIFSKKTHN